MNEYKPVGMIKQPPACRKNYKGKNPAGGRKLPTSYIGAAVRWSSKPKWERGIESNMDVQVRFIISDATLQMIPEIDAQGGA